RQCGHRTAASAGLRSRIGQAALAHNNRQLELLGEEHMIQNGPLNSTARRDIAFHLHSQTNPKLFNECGPLIVSRGEGIRVFDSAGKPYIDAMAGLWCASLGFSDKRLAEAATKQYAELGFYHTFFQRTHEPAAALAEKLVELTGMTGGKAYFATSGSEANE